MTQAAKAERFRALHAGEPFVIPNPWDAGSARVMAALGFEALASTSSGFAFTLGRLDGGATLDEVVAHTAALDQATDLPVSVDLENGYGADPESAARAISRVAEAGAVGGSIEDYDPDGRIYELGHAVERVAAAVEAARALDFPFTLTARAENHIHDNPDLEDTIVRLQAFEQAERRRPLRARAADGRGHQSRLRGGLQARERARVTHPDGARDRRRRRAAHQRGREPDLGCGQRDGRGGAGDPRHGRPLVAIRAGAARRVVRLLSDGTHTGSSLKGNGARSRKALTCATRAALTVVLLGLGLVGPALGASSHEDRYDPAVAFDGTNYLVVWQDRRPGVSFDIYAARVSDAGAVLDPLGIPISKAVGNQWAPAVAFDGTNFVVAWQDDRSTSTGPNVYGGRVSPAGILLDPGGIPISTAPGAQLMPAVARAGASSLVVWTEGGAASDIRGARVSPAGAVLDPAGLSVSAAAGAQLNPAVAFGTSSSLVVWDDYRTGPSADLYGARVTEAGALLDPAGLAIAAGPDYERNGAVAFDGSSFLAAWDSYAAGAGSDVLARRISTGGALLGSGSVAVAVSAGSQARPALAFDGANFLVAWQDDRVSVFDIHAVRVSPAGVVLAPAAAISTAAQAQLGGALAHGTTGSLVAWEDRRAGQGMSDIVGARVAPSGAVLDPAGIFIPKTRDLRAPQTRITRGPRGRQTARAATFRFRRERSGIELPVPPRSRRLARVPLSEDLPRAASCGRTASRCAGATAPGTSIAPLRAGDGSSTTRSRGSCTWSAGAAGARGRARCAATRCRSRTGSRSTGARWPTRSRGSSATDAAGAGRAASPSSACPRGR